MAHSLRHPIVLPLTAILALLGFAHAQLGAEVSPANLYLTGEPGATITRTLTVRNPTKGEVALEVVPSDFVLTPDHRINPLPVSSLPASLASWLDVGVSELTLAPNEQRTFSFALTIPASAAPGTHWGALLFRTPTRDSAAGGNGVGMSIRAQVAFVVVLDIGPLQRSGAVTSVNVADAADATAGAAQQVSVGFQNTGDTYLRLQGRIEVRTPDGALVESVQLDPVPSFPQQLSEIVAPLGQRLGTGTYVATAVLDYGTPDLIAGQATVQVP